MEKTLRRKLTQALLAGAAIAATILVPAAPAAAHVTVTPTTVTPGGRATFTFKVPNERDDADTVKVEVFFPENAALSSVSLRPVPGWTATVNRGPAAGTASQPAGEGHADADGVVTGIVWQSTTGVKPGEFQTFDVAGGPLPDQPGTLIFKAVQTYSNGEVVRWIEPPQEGAAKPDHPAMVVTVAAASSPASAVPAAPETSGGSGPALPIAALVTAALALVAALAALIRRRPTAQPAPAPTASPSRPVAAGKR